MDEIEQYFAGVPNFEPRVLRQSERAKKAITKKNRKNNNKTRKGLKGRAWSKMKALKPTFHAAQTRVRAAAVPVAAPSVDRIKATQAHFESLPIFIINAHACVCQSAGRCFGKDIPSQFAIPTGTYILGFAQAGESACLGDEWIVGHRDEIPRFMMVHSESDVERSRVGKTRFGFFTGVRRATGGVLPDGSTVMYPNINYTFNEWDDKHKALVPPSKNPHGVYEFDRFVAESPMINNTHSLIKQDKSREDWPLEDIIQEVYRVKGISSAIFLSAGCFVLCPDGSGAPINPATVSAELQKAGVLVDQANAVYTTLVDTFTREELEAIPGFELPVDYGVPLLTAFPEPYMIKENVRLGLLNKEVAANRRLVHANNLKEMQRFVKGSKAAGGP